MLILAMPFLSRDLNLLVEETCPAAGCGLWHLAARAALRATRPYRRNPRKPVRGDNREPARIAGASLHRGRADRKGSGPVGQIGIAVAAALGADRSRRAAHASVVRVPDEAHVRSKRVRAAHFIVDVTRDRLDGG